MAYRTKLETIAEAERLRIDVSEMTWPEMQSAVAEALKAEQAAEASEPAVLPVQEGDTKMHDFNAGDPLDAYRGKTVNISPELASDPLRGVMYKETIGDDVAVEEKYFDLNDLSFSAESNDVANGSYRIKGRTGRQVEADAYLPKENAQIVFRPGVDLFPVVTFNGKSGYLLTHHRLPSFKALLKESGYFEDYRHLLIEEPNVFYLTGLLCVQPSVAHQIMKDIEEREAMKRSGKAMPWRRL